MKKVKRDRAEQVVGQLLPRVPLDQLLNDDYFEHPWDFISEQKPSVELSKMRGKVLEFLDPEEYQYLIEWFGNNQSEREIAEKLGVYRNRVRRKLQSAKKKLKQNLGVDFIL